MFLTSPSFNKGFLLTFVLTGLFFLWELGFISDVIPGIPRLPRPDANTMELTFTTALIVLLSFNVGLLQYQKSRGVCPVGIKAASTVAGALGAVALLCPACLLIPISLLGLSLSLVFLAPYIPLLQIIALILLGTSTYVLWPKS